MEFEAIGTHWRIDVYDEAAAGQLKIAMAAVSERIEAFDKAYSRFRGDSLVSRMARSAGAYELPSDAAPMLALCRELYDLTDGLVTPLIGQVLADAGYDAAYSLQPGELHMPPAWDDVMRYHPPKGKVPSRLEIIKPVLLDFGAAGKGYLVDLVADVLRTYGFKSFCVDASGDLYVQGKPLRIGLEHPADPSQVVGVANVHNASLCGSAGNRRAWAGLHHIMNPRSLTPANDVLAVWTVAKTGLLADALATCLFFVDAPKLKARYDFQYVLLKPDYSFEVSPGFDGQILTV